MWWPSTFSHILNFNTYCKKKTQHNNNDGIMFCRLYCVFCVLIQVTISPQHFFWHFFPPFSHQSPQAVTCFLLRHNWRRQNSLVWEGNKWAWLPSFCSFGDSISLVRSQQYKCQQVIGPRGDILSPSLVCMRGNNPFLCGLVRPAPRHGSSGFNQTSVLVSEGGLLMEIENDLSFPSFVSSCLPMRVNS